MALTAAGLAGATALSALSAPMAQATTPKTKREWVAVNRLVDNTYSSWDRIGRNGPWEGEGSSGRTFSDVAKIKVPARCSKLGFSVDVRDNFDWPLNIKVVATKQFPKTIAYTGKTRAGEILNVAIKKAGGKTFLLDVWNDDPNDGVTHATFDFAGYCGR